jgi:asparagine synthase (glutamine-hydrolysing)
LNGRDPLNKSLFVWAKSVLPNYILNLLGDRMEMAHSVEGRVPFLDHHVVECVCRAPVSLKIRGVTEKYLLREAAKPLITETVYRRQKHPFLSPPVTTVPTEQFHQLMQDTLRGPVLASLPFYDQKKVVALLDQLPAMSDLDRVGWDPALMSVLSACVIQERFGLGSKAAGKIIRALRRGAGLSKVVSRRHRARRHGLLIQSETATGKCQSHVTHPVDGEPNVDAISRADHSDL